MDQITNYFNRIDQLTRTYLKPGELPLVALAGPYNSGKSTMINNLLGAQVSPVDIVPTTGVPILFSYGELFSVQARLSDGRVKVLKAGDMAPAMRDTAAAGTLREMEVSLRHPLLQKMHLLDTPGMDAAGEPPHVPHRLMQADHIAYLLHQRGPGEADRWLINLLLETVDAGRISFWLNRNLGHYDGTSLLEAQRVLREICGRETRVYATDSTHPEAVQRFRLYIMDRAAAVVLARVSERLKKMDGTIPALAGAALREDSDSGILIRYWEARRVAGEVLRGQRSIMTLVPVSHQIRDAVEKLIRPEKPPRTRPAVCGPAAAAPDPAGVRARIAQLLSGAAGDPLLGSRPETDLLKTLVRELEHEQYLVTAAGGFSTGKTTFFNALLGESLLPAENRPTTFAVTRLYYGAHKRAVINYASRVTIPTHFVENGQATICRHELAVLERWLTDPGLRPQIAALERGQGKQLSRITPDQVLQELETVKAAFARVRRRFNGGRRPWKSLFKRIPLPKFTKGGLPHCFVVHFQDRASAELDLSGPDGRAALREIAGSHLALRVESIDISYPADILRTATFVDTPGLDSVYHRHREITSRYLPQSDCFLFFLNSKHLLTRPDVTVYRLITRYLKDAPGAAGKLFVIVNFADTLEARDRERVRHHLHANLVRPAGGALDPGRIYLVSALDALTGRDDTSFQQLAADLKQQIWLARCAANYADIIRRACAVLESMLHDGTDTEPAPAPPGDNLRREAEMLRRQTSQTLAGWREKIATLTEPADFHGLRHGRRKVKKGLWGIKSRTVPCPSCRDLAGEVNAALARFQARWNHGGGVDITGLNAATLENTLDQLLNQKRFKPREAGQVLCDLLKTEEARIRRALLVLEKELDGGESPRDTAGTGSAPPPGLAAAVQKHIQGLEKLAKQITSPGGINNGKRQGAG